MRKFRVFLMIFFSLCLLLSSCADKNESKSEKNKFIYETFDGTVTILGYSGLESEIIIPEEIDGLPVTAIAENAFKKMAGLVSVTVADSVKVIDYAFVSCPDLESVHIGSSVLAMNGAFKDCPKLKSVTGGESAIEMSEAFMNCVSLESGVIPSGVTSCVSAFKGCKNLTGVTISEGVSFLAMTFEGCVSLESVSLPSTVKSAPDAFKGCEALKNVSGEESLAELEGTFEGCKALTALELSKNVAKMSGAFVGCSALTVIENLPQSVTEYSPSFTGCSSLEYIVIPDVSEESLDGYILSEDISGCVGVKSITVNASFVFTEEFCKTFSGLSLLEEINMSDEMAENVIRVNYIFSDKVFEGENSSLQKAVNKYRKASNVRITENYANIEGVSYNYIYGGDVDFFDVDEYAEALAVKGFEPISKSYFWCGYPEGGNRKNETVGIERTYSFFLRVTGKNDGTLPETVIINGMTCEVN